MEGVIEILKSSSRCVDAKYLKKEDGGIVISHTYLYIYFFDTN